MLKKLLIITVIILTFSNLAFAEDSANTTSSSQLIEAPIQNNFQIGNENVQNDNIKTTLKATYCTTVVNRPLNIRRINCQTSDCILSRESPGCSDCNIDGTSKTINISQLYTNAEAEAISNINFSAGFGSAEGTVSCIKQQVITGSSGFDLLTNYISIIYTWAAGVVGTIAVLVIIISSIQITVAGGNSGSVETARGRITQSLTGLAIVFLSGLILYIINPGFFVNG